MNDFTRRSFMGLAAGATLFPKLVCARGPEVFDALQAAPGSLGWQVVTMFGAKGDGVTDDASAIQLAIDAASKSPRGGVVFFPPGEYRVGMGLHIRTSGVSLIGSGPDTSRLVGGGAAVALLELGTPTVPVYRWMVRDLGLSDPDDKMGCGLRLAYAREGTATDLRVSLGFARAGVELVGAADAGCWTNRLDRVSIMRTAGDGVILGPQSNAVMMTGCHFTSCGGVHLRLLQAQGVKLIACQFEQAGSGNEIYIGDKGARVLGLGIAHCYFELKSHVAAARALYVHDAEGAVDVLWLTFEDNFVWGQGTSEYLVEMNTAQSAVTGSVSRNALFGALHSGVRIRPGPRVEVSVDGPPGVKGYGVGEELPLLEAGS